MADTHWEPPSVYEHIESLRDRLSFPLYVVDNGRSLREDVKALTNPSDSRTYIDIPVYLEGRHGEGDGIGRRQCTDNYKVSPIRRRIRELLGLVPRQRVPAGTTVELWLGISTDEAIRMNTSRDRWIANRYPLIETGMSRRDCADWWAARYDVAPRIYQSTGVTVRRPTDLRAGQRELFDFQVYLGSVSWHGRPSDVLVLQSDSVPLLGMALLWGSRIAMDALDGGEVLIEELLTHNRRERALTLACWSGYDSERKLARRCCKHPGPWRHLLEQVMRIDCTTRRPALDRRRVFFIFEGKKERRKPCRESR